MNKLKNKQIISIKALLKRFIGSKYTVANNTVVMLLTKIFSAANKIQL